METTKPKQPRNKSTLRQIYVKPELHAKLRVMAHREGRLLHRQVEMLLIDALAKEGVK
jgi:hypothetical protein